MEEKAVYITNFDLERLGKILEGSARGQQDLDKLEEEMDQCEIVDSRKIPPDVVTLNSKVRLRDLDGGKERVVTLVLPQKENIAAGRISVTTPIGTAILGYAAGDTIEWEVRSAARRIRVEEIIYQPEAAGDYHL